MKTLAIFTCSLLCSVSAWSDIAVVVGKSSAVATIDAAELERVFTGKSKSLGGSEVEPINQAENSSTTEEFNRLALNKSNSQVKAYWSKLVFTGKGQIPKAVNSDAEMIATLKNDPKAIGYVDAAAVSSDVKVLMTLK